MANRLWATGTPAAIVLFHESLICCTSEMQYGSQPRTHKNICMHLATKAAKHSAAVSQVPSWCPLVTHNCGQLVLHKSGILKAIRVQQPTATVCSAPPELFQAAHLCHCDQETRSGSFRVPLGNSPSSGKASEGGLVWGSARNQLHLLLCAQTTPPSQLWELERSMTHWLLLSTTSSKRVRSSSSQVLMSEVTGADVRGVRVSL